ncbi:hypothetical protein CORC01_00591 [Colletotrichum orchidophilum]|uniref:Uncharacterized protein n=1 Tax=Colletotrichum orchidophilum TaxID=1209926 RepID=A0A1G4BS20_9PEZI|nr:uncharacterized protein CORC01_00591 [Colletotrichum orchidophilum]OHF04252.1 hypothetical protein CORC01_00591 [Colletotrichum orchidophilum]
MEEEKSWPSSQRSPQGCRRSKSSVEGGSGLGLVTVSLEDATMRGKHAPRNLRAFPLASTSDVKDGKYESAFLRLDGGTLPHPTSPPNFMLQRARHRRMFFSVYNSTSQSVLNASCRVLGASEQPSLLKER